MMCSPVQQKAGTGKEELEYRNTGISLRLNEDMPGKSLNDYSGGMLFLCSAFKINREIGKKTAGRNG
jgi:hypothetical protein